MTWQAGTAKVTSNKDDDVKPATDANQFVVDLVGGANVITIKTEAANAIATETYTVTVTRATATASTDANLSSLTLSNVRLSEDFDPGKTAYKAVVRNSVGLTTVRARPADSGAVVDIAATKTDDTTADNSVIDSRNVVTLSAGETTTTITITVTAANAVAMKEYTVEVTRAVKDANSSPKLAPVDTDPVTDSGLALQTNDASPDPIDLHPGYSPDKTAYTAIVEYAVAEVRVHANPAPADTSAEPPVVGTGTVKVTSNKDDDVDMPVAADATQFVVKLAEGANVITIRVDAANAIATETYTVTVTRASATASTDANLSSLTLSNVRLSEDFDPGKTGYTAVVPNSVGLTTVRARPADSGAVVDIAATKTDDTTADNSVIDSRNVVTLSAGETTTTITITVTAANAVETKDYTVVVTRAAFNASDDASLVTSLVNGADIPGLRLETGDGITPADTDDLYLNMPFFPTRTDYTTTADRGLSSVIVVTRPAMGARVMVSSNRDDEVKPFDADPPLVAFDAFDVDLEPGINVITIKVTAENAVKMQTYTVTVTRPGEVVASSDATLQALTLSGITLTPAFSPGRTAYTAEVEDVETTTVGATATNPSATVQGTGEKTLRIGVNVINVRVLAEDGTTTQTYTVTVTVLDEDGMVTPGDDLLDRYDADDSGHIDLSEVNKAIDDYFDDLISLANVNTVIDLYFE